MKRIPSWWPGARPALVLTLVFIAVLMGGQVLASHALNYTVDADGPDDVSLQEDITLMGFDISHLSEDLPYWSVAMNFDDTTFPGGNSGDAVGSVQDDEFGSHDHDGYSNLNLLYAGGGGRPNDAPNGRATSGRYWSTLNTGGNETRPKNANVNYIIKL